jgi:hypothetical protein
MFEQTKGISGRKLADKWGFTAAAVTIARKKWKAGLIACTDRKGKCATPGKARRSPSTSGQKTSVLESISLLPHEYEQTLKEND